MDIHKILAELGLEDKKGKVYLACLEMGSGTASAIADRAGIQRTTVYEILHSLMKEGLVSSLPKEHGSVFIAEPPIRLESLLKEKQKKLEKILPTLESYFHVETHQPKVRFYEGREGVRTVFMDTLTTNEGRLRAILSISDLYEFIGIDWFHEYTTKRITSGAKLFVLRSESKEVGGVFPTSTKDNREVRLVPRGMEFSLSQYLYNNKVAIISTKKEGYGMIIESAEYYQTQSNLFETLWDVSRGMKRVD